jgi:hypothetical protein
VPGARVEKDCVCSPAVRSLCSHFQGGVLALEGSDASLRLAIGTAVLVEGVPLMWPLKVLAEPLPE